MFNQINGKILLKCLPIDGSVIGLQNFRYVCKQNNYLEEIKKCCDVLNISYDFTANELKNAFLETCKRTHPDLNACAGSDGCALTEFLTAENAYNKLKDHLKVRENQNKQDLKPTEEVEEEKEAQIKHTVPQHRQYLSYDGVGFGTVSDRQKQYERHRLTRATNRVNEFIVNKINSSHELSEEKSIVLKDANLQREMKVRQGFDRLVEDLIQESMARGDFQNLAGYGKPLKPRPEYPYLDSTTYKINEILINNGFVPEWVLLEREIRDEKNIIRNELISLKNDSKLENISLIKQLLENKVKEVNKKIDKYNRIVPILRKQQILLVLEKEVNKVRQMSANTDSNCVSIESINNNNNVNEVQNNSNLDFNSKANESNDRIKANNFEDRIEKRENLLKKIFSFFT